MRLLNVVSAAALLVALVGTASAETYRYTDDQGSLHFVDSLGEVPKKYRRKATVAGEGGNVSYADPTPVTQRAKPASDEGRQTAARTVEMYVTSWCPACKAALSYVRQNGIAYAAYDIEKDPDAKRRFEGYSGRGVPLIVVGDKTMRGFNARTLEQWLSRLP